MVKLLIKKKADLNCRNCRGQTALHLALKYGYTDVAELLVEKVRASELSSKYSFRVQFSICVGSLSLNHPPPLPPPIYPLSHSLSLSLYIYLYSKLVVYHSEELDEDG